LRFHNSHSSTSGSFAAELVALLHVKLCDELQRRLDQPDVISNHYRRGLAYHQLRQALMQRSEATLVYEGTRTYRRSEDLEQVGIIGPNVARLWASDGPREVLTPAAAAA
jgi:hypothetical protein